ncbi:hypothetical protein A2574_03205 [Candidatus Shapirobacteria bacterium RIFOXYD1_FULL_38_32]|uniref:Uncharacterized protein n=3 Tax=Candidatus Shapironibacteriota TaxID=1752721 RepID=A0A0G0MZ65_9BACT|nr:MAG: hypothetical protein US90_C0008G0048 [Candidatus Shapirobacteria bacterium GW2011_GWE2_38_30]KKQ89367.1 MAG: hypothetical protein UT14_C0060G0011 [Candidatus Shapirobacteria bacterium GW2011_GWE1_38_92]OGL55925.1 MAG: hypothetical protein A2367_02010 [Candidatus Shapirobacteria bacterium RIFOXYB1_FULL_38_38]OGL56559.1 MAG: hypothetical protein A2195_00625 [Candidatus Shapirobacteria bacterium RIFOXYA1_FULL_39_17]OGL56685.1 MAG: hypothetical protein A2410_01425 [Candidatus Shapirobacteri
MSPVKWTEIVSELVTHSGATRTKTTHGIISATENKEFIFPLPGTRFSIQVFGDGTMYEVTLDRNGKPQGVPNNIRRSHETAYEKNGKRVTLEYIPPNQPSTLDLLTGDTFRPKSQLDDINNY